MLRGRKYCALFLLLLLTSAFYYFCINILGYGVRSGDHYQLEEAFIESEPSLNYLDDSTAHLVWFMQISDLHLSVFHDQTRIKDFDYFCKEIVGLIKPNVVLATGDLTDAKASDLTGSRQYENEWKAYHKVITENGILTRTVWLDVRGNHDNFDVPDSSDGRNFFR
jgi:predicted MPP superfamily phosphohydrolase